MDAVFWWAGAAVCSSFAAIGVATGVFVFYLASVRAVAKYISQFGKLNTLVVDLKDWVDAGRPKLVGDAWELQASPKPGSHPPKTGQK